jgi:hypothetical protein
MMIGSDLSIRNNFGGTIAGKRTMVSHIDLAQFRIFIGQSVDNFPGKWG